MVNLKIELSFQKEVSKNVTTKSCNSCEYFKLVNNEPVCLFNSLDIADCALVIKELNNHTRN